MGVAEWAYGVTDWFEHVSAAIWFSPNDGTTYNGFKLRWLFVKPHADGHKFFYGVNFEFSVNRAQWDPRHYTSEVRPIAGWYLKLRYYLQSDDGHFLYRRIREPGFCAIGAGGLQFFAKMGRGNRSGKVINIETGIGFGLTTSSDRVTLKFMISRDLN